jgi:hypothetical protein
MGYELGQHLDKTSTFYAQSEIILNKIKLLSLKLSKMVFVFETFINEHRLKYFIVFLYTVTCSIGKDTT